jgi:hypothetical protein
MPKSSTNDKKQGVPNSINCSSHFNEILRLKDKITKQALEIAELKQKLLRAKESRKDARMKSDYVAAPFCSINKLSCNINVKSVISFGLDMAGFEAKRQTVRDSLNMQRFRAHFGVGPETIVAMLKDLLPSKPEAIDVIAADDLKDLMMMLCWLKLYETEHVMSGRWGYGEEYCREAVKQNATRIQCLKKAKIQFGPFESERTYVGTIDCVHCETNEFRTDPDSKWYSHKHNGAGVSYEVAVDFYDDKIILIAGPYPASTHDITIFRGGTQVSKSQQNNKTYWDQNALYFKIPKGKRLIGNSGYNGEPSKISGSKDEHSAEVKEFFAQAKSRQETINTRLKSFSTLSCRFCHGKGVEDKLEAHQRCFEAVCVLVQYVLKFNPLMEV